MTRLAILTVKDEGAFLLEWVAHHLTAGFDRILAFSNDCSDGTAAMLDRLAQVAPLDHVAQQGPFPKGPQWAALNAAEKHPAFRAAEWAMPIDIDEFVNIHLGDGTLDALFAAAPEATEFAFPWRFFGNGGRVRFTDAPVTGQFLRAAPAGMAWPWRASIFKTLSRNDGGYARLGVHRPRQPTEGAVRRWVGGSGRPLPPRYGAQGLFVPPTPDQHAAFQLNHYALGAMESYILKAARGRANRDAAAHDLSYWIERNFDTETDLSIAPLAARAAGLAAGLRADPVLGALHAAAVDWRHARFAALMAEEPWRAMLGRLMLAPPSRPLAPEAAELILKFARQANSD